MENRAMNNIIGQRIENVLRSSRISQTEMANRMGITKQILNAYIRGKHRIPADAVAFIARECNISADYILGLKDDMVPVYDSFEEDFGPVRESYSKLTLAQRQAMLNFLTAFKPKN